MCIRDRDFISNMEQNSDVQREDVLQKYKGLVFKNPGRSLVTKVLNLEKLLANNSTNENNYLLTRISLKDLFLLKTAKKNPSPVVIRVFQLLAYLKDQKADNWGDIQSNIKPLSFKAELSRLSREEIDPVKLQFLSKLVSASKDISKGEGEFSTLGSALLNWIKLLIRSRSKRLMGRELGSDKNLLEREQSNKFKQHKKRPGKSLGNATLTELLGKNPQAIKLKKSFTLKEKLQNKPAIRSLIGSRLEETVKCSRLSEALCKNSRNVSVTGLSKKFRYLPSVKIENSMFDSDKLFTSSTNPAFKLSLPNISLNKERHLNNLDEKEYLRISSISKAELSVTLGICREKLTNSSINLKKLIKANC
eukprot:TRINITY_DN16802_c0_g1_i2.p1 TRINITY_DN16802_c0_g1~~TRINITY_DN16802_c0_g1_i2.p1  ORF type:complete len:363 (-),score=48.59 TRINITY_DN16802_c0_g1_i2:127-1215(-)